MKKSRLRVVTTPIYKTARRKEECIMVVVSIRTGSHSFRTVAARKLLNPSAEQARIVDIFLSCDGKIEDYPFDTIKPLPEPEDMEISTSSIVDVHRRSSRMNKKE